MLKMLKKHSKGQSAIEYLANNAWVIVVAVIGMIVLWQLGIFTPPTPKRGSLGFSQITPSDWVVSTGDVAYVRMANDGGVPVKIRAGKMSLDVYQVPCDAGQTPNVDVTLNPGESKIFVFHCSGATKISENFKVGDYYEGDITVEYVNQVSGAQHKSVGKIFGPIEGKAQFGGGVTTTTLPGNCGDDCTQPGLVNATDCTKDNDLNCTYCDLYGYECKPEGSCGKPCTQETAAIDCEITCTWCNPSNNRCEQGDCGKPCTVDEECTYGCEDCINNICSNPEERCPDCSQTFGGVIDPLECINDECQFCLNWVFTCSPQGDCEQACLSDNDCDITCCYCNSGSKKCEQGDCLKPCTRDSECTKGCNECIGGVCKGCGVTTSTITATSTSSSTSSTSTSSTTTQGDSGYIIVGQIYPKNGSTGYATAAP
jgi:hypothetical protein